MAVTESIVKEEEKRRKEWHEELYNECPFIWPRSPITKNKIPSWDFNNSSLDAVPEGWKRSFIKDFCRDVQRVLDKDQKEDDPFIFTRINSIFGHFTVHSTWTNEELDSINKKYEEIGLHTCEECGNKATVRGTRNGIPYCDKCKQKYIRFNTFIPVDEFKEFGQDGY